MGIKEELLRKIREKKARICVIGLGYVGLPTAVFFGEQGFDVVGVDVDEKKVGMVKNGKSPSPELISNDVINILVSSGKLNVTTEVSQAVGESDIVLIIVPTPVTKMKQPDLKHVISACEDVAKSLSKGKLVVMESTTFPGTCEEVIEPILNTSGLKAGEDYGLAYCPERYNPGDKNHTLEKVARIVGAIDPEWAEIARELYQTIIKEKVTVVKDLKTAEAAKVIENIQRDLNIALVNELALIFEKMGLDIMDVLNAAGTKWNFHRFEPGAGVGGHCLPVDPYYLTAKAEELGHHPEVILAGRSINDYMPEHVFELLGEALNEFEMPIKNSKIVILGFSYKANIGDVREAPAEKLVEKLKEKKAEVVIVDNYVDREELTGFGLVNEDVYDALKGADALVLMTEHDEFKNLDWKRIKELMKTAIIVDGRRIIDSNEVETLGFSYMGIGRGC